MINVNDLNVGRRSLTGVVSGLSLRAAATLLGAAMLTASAPGQSVEWVQRATEGPAIRTMPAISFDPVRNQTVLFGGTYSTYYNDTWVWDGTVWTQRDVTGPSARWAHSMVFDPVRNVTVLFGGFTLEFGGFPNDQTWEWDGAAWTQRTVTGPSGRYWGGMVYDSGRNVVVYFGGRRASWRRETWEWNGTAWTQVNAGGPTARGRIAMAYDAARRESVIFGGSDNTSDYLNETWTWNGTEWTQKQVTGPSARYDSAMAYDAGRGVCVLYGGYNGSYLSDTWEWNGTAWTQLNIAGTGARTQHAMTYDSARGVIVLFGGTVSDTFANDTWELGGGACTGPSISDQPDSGSGCLAGTVTIEATAEGTGPLTYQWKKDAATIDTDENPSAGTAALTLPGLRASDAGAYVCVVSNGCGSIESDPAVLSICVGDFNCDGGVDGSDVEAFYGAWEQGVESGDINDDGGVDGQDVEAFYARWEAGC